MSRFGRRRHHRHNAPRRRRRYRGSSGGGSGYGFLAWLGPLVTVALFAAVFLASAGQNGGLACVEPGARDASDIEHYIHQYTNEQRVLGGLEPLRHVTAIDDIAKAHSEDMAARDYFSHYTPEGLDQTARGERAGYGCTKNYGTYYTHGLGENIFQYNGIPRCDNSSDVARYTVSEWMHSPGHRANIMDLAYDELGVGIAFDGRGSMYATQNFC
ncbi:MAG: CAP domain-containing protein [Thaumarchaeota archaeon]|nr:CAP domain-containing protein [Nitrososphaerota archaeon]